MARRLTPEERRKFSAELSALKISWKPFLGCVAVVAGLWGFIAVRLAPILAGRAEKLLPSEGIPLVALALLGGLFAYGAFFSWAFDRARLRRDGLRGALESDGIEDREGPLERLPWTQLLGRPNFRIQGETFVWLGEVRELPRSAELVRVVHLPKERFVVDVRRRTPDASWNEADLRIFLEDYAVDSALGDSRDELLRRAQRFLDEA